MKNFKKAVSLFTLITSLVFLSCESEPLDQSLLETNSSTGGGSTGGGSTSTSIVGAYKLTAFNTSVPTDLNNDGTASTNQLNETSCYNNSLLVLNSNNTFTADSKGVEIDFTANTLECFTDPDITGTWVLNGSILSLTYVDGGTTYTDNFTVSGSNLSFSVNDGDVVSILSGNPVYVTSNIQFVYTKQ